MRLGGKGLSMRANNASSASSALIVDDQPLRMDGLEALLRGLGVAEVARATSYEEASSMVEGDHPEILIANYALARDGNEGEDGVAERPLALLGRARAANTGVKCIVFSDRDDPFERACAFRSGATAFCVKHAAAVDFAVAVRQAFEPSMYLAPTAAPADAARTTDPDRRWILTKRETEILRLAADGRSSSNVAKLLWITEPTVKFHLSNIYRKLGVTNRTEASLWAHQNGLLAGDVDSSMA
jgi:DNA-binding NarL/FixJ family response regulator